MQSYRNTDLNSVTFSTANYLTFGTFSNRIHTQNMRVCVCVCVLLYISCEFRAVCTLM